jgi:hypothetical protein
MSRRIENKTQCELPEELAVALGKWCADAMTVYYLIWLDLNTAVGVYGDGAMGCYEWFVWRGVNVALSTSELGYGNPAGALRDVLNEEWPA